MESEQRMANQVENAAEEVDEITEAEESAAIVQAEAQESAATEEVDGFEMTEGEDPAAIAQTDVQESAATQSATDTSEQGGEA